MEFNRKKAMKKKAEIAYKRRMIDDQYPMEDTFNHSKANKETQSD